jgi:hypothetical protein
MLSFFFNTEEKQRKAEKSREMEKNIEINVSFFELADSYVITIQAFV